jgi:hypothetical protein
MQPLVLQTETTPEAGARLGPLVERLRDALTSLWSRSTDGFAHVVRQAGWIPVMAVLSALGLTLAAISDAAARAGFDAIGAPLLWIALLTIFIPILWRLLATDAERGERIALVVMLGMAFFAIKLLQSPSSFTLYDETLHLRTLNDIERSGRLAMENPLLPVSPLYPGLEVVTDALVRLGGLPTFAAGIAVSAVARLFLVMALFLFLEEVTASARLAGVAAAIYATNPNFLFFGAQWAYETVALPLVVAVLWLVARRWQRSDERGRLTILALAVVAAIVVTHHISGIALVGFLLLWTLVSIVFRSLPAGQGVGALTLLVAVLVATWITYAASLTVGYLAPSVTAAVGGLIAVIAGETPPRELFRSTSGAVAPLWERATALATSLTLTVAVFAGGWRLVRGKRPSVLTLGLVLVGLSYPASLAFRLSTQGGAQASGRTVEFIFIGLAMSAAVAATALWDAGLRPPSTRPLVLGLSAVVLVGGVIIGWPASGRLPGPYLVAADARSIDDYSLVAAEWTRSSLGAGRRFMADRSNRALLSAYGDQNALVPSTTSVALWPLYFATQLGHTEVIELRDARVQYVLIDRRLSQSVPEVRFYVEPGERARPNANDPIPEAALGKFDGQLGSDRIYDNGSIQIYDVRALSHAP